MNEETEGFTYDYSAKQQSEVKAIRERYAPPSDEQSKLEELKKLDQTVQNAGLIPALSVGTIGALIMGIGMCCTLVWQGIWFIPGIIIGVIGIVGILLAYPLNNRLVQKRKTELTPQILKLTEELMK